MLRRFVLSWLVTVLTSLAVSVPSHGDEHGIGQKQAFAIVNLSYTDPVTGATFTEQSEMGIYGSDSRTDSEWGLLVHVRTADNKTHGCSKPINAPGERWIALVERGTCKFQDKIQNSAILLNASAVVIYDHHYQDELLTMKHSVSDVVSIFISKRDGERLASMVDNGTKILIHIYYSRAQHSMLPGSVNRTSVLFVSVSFVLLMVISIAWLVFYYVQRFRFAHSKDRLSKRLTNAAKKAVSKMEQKTLHKGDCETEPDFDLCAICVESYKVTDIIRILPCRHVFHKTCVDPWLVERRNCPICKLDILQACGIHVNPPRESQGSHVSTNIEAPYFMVETNELLVDDSARYISVVE